MALGRKTGGRQPGSRNKSGLELRSAAQKYTKDALKTLHQIMMTGESEPARVSAANALLDRAYGKPAQALTDGEGGPLIPATVIHEHLHG